MNGRAGLRVVGAVWLGLSLCACADVTVVAIEDGAGVRRLDVEVEVARTEAERRLGLGGRETLPASEGLWMELPIRGEVCIVNETVTFPIDVVFVSDGAVTDLALGVAAGETAATCRVATHVLEVAAGVAGSVEVGDRAAVR